MRVFFIVPYVPNRVRTRPFHFIKALVSLGHEVTLGAVQGPGDSLDELNDLVPRQRIISEIQTQVMSARCCLASLFTGKPLQASFSWNRSLASRLSRVAVRELFDVIHVEHLRGSRYGLHILSRLRGNGKSSPVVWDAVDCISHLFEQAVQSSSNRGTRWIARLELGRTRRQEARLLEQFSTTVVTSQRDREALLDVSRRQPLGHAQMRSLRLPSISVVENGVDLDYFHPSLKSPRDNRTIVFTGKMSYHANVTAIRRFVDEVLPRVQSSHPDVRFIVVGKDPPPEIRRLGQPLSQALEGGSRSGGVYISGTVPDIRPFLWKASVAVAPIAYGAGIQNKVLEAMACGTPVVATKKAVSGLPDRSGRECLVRDASQDFASAVSSLLEHPELATALSTEGRAYVERFHGWKDSALKLEEVYRQAQLRKSALFQGQISR